MKKVTMIITVMAMLPLATASVFAGDVGGRPIKMSFAPAQIDEVYIEERLDEVTTSAEALE